MVKSLKWKFKQNLKLKFGQYFAAVNCYFGKQNSTLGSVVPLAMFVFVYLPWNSPLTKTGIGDILVQIPGSDIFCVPLLCAFRSNPYIRIL